MHAQKQAGLKNATPVLNTEQLYWEHSKNK